MTFHVPPRFRPAVQALLSFSHLRHYPARAMIIFPGDVGDRLFLIIEGSVSIIVEDENGHELVLAYLNAGDFIGEIGVFKNAEAREVCVRSRCPCKLAEIGYPRLHTLLKNELKEHAADIYYLLGEQLAARLLITSRKFWDLAFLDVEGRVARILLDLSKQPEAMTHPKGMQLSVTRQEIARLVGCSREMAGRVLKELESKGLISAHGKTIVVFNTR
ncbi:MAG: cAMP-activated global transcriptional regulator CRP [Methylococcales bacterium]|nr:cAMP-activated global transcriptional regulator CRP [Methylococcales bacterium]